MWTFSGFCFQRNIDFIIHISRNFHSNQLNHNKNNISRIPSDLGKSLFNWKQFVFLYVIIAFLAINVYIHIPTGWIQIQSVKLHRWCLLQRKNRHISSSLPLIEGGLLSVGLQRSFFHDKAHPLEEGSRYRRRLLPQQYVDRIVGTVAVVRMFTGCWGTTFRVLAIR